MLPDSYPDHCNLGMCRPCTARNSKSKFYVKYPSFQVLAEKVKEIIFLWINDWSVLYKGLFSRAFKLRQRRGKKGIMPLSATPLRARRFGISCTVRFLLDGFQCILADK